MSSRGRATSPPKKSEPAPAKSWLQWPSCIRGRCGPGNVNNTNNRGSFTPSNVPANNSLPNIPDIYKIVEGDEIYRALKAYKASKGEFASFASFGTPRESPEWRGNGVLETLVELIIRYYNRNYNSIFEIIDRTITETPGVIISIKKGVYFVYKGDSLLPADLRDVNFKDFKKWLLKEYITLYAVNIIRSGKFWPQETRTELYAAAYFHLYNETNFLLKYGYGSTYSNVKRIFLELSKPITSGGSRKTRSKRSKKPRKTLRRNRRQ